MCGHRPGILDALPVHQFEFSTQFGWCERLVDLASSTAESDDSTAPMPRFRLVKSQGKTPATVAYIRDHFQTAHHGDTLEVCPGACAVVQDIALRLKRDGGTSLFIDYGPGVDEGPPGSSVRGISKHGFCSFLTQPGNVDITVRFCVAASFNPSLLRLLHQANVVYAMSCHVCMNMFTYGYGRLNVQADVDFAALRRVVDDLPSSTEEQTQNISAFGPVTQGQFLGRMGIQVTDV